MAANGFLKKIEETLKQAGIGIADAEAARGIADLRFMPHEPKFMPYLPSALPPMQSPSPMLIGADFGQGKDLHSLMLIEIASSKAIHCSKNAIVSINSDWIAKVRENDFVHLPSPSCRAEWNARVSLTHKQTRQIRKALKLKKPRIPRKLKKKLKTDLKLMRYARGK